MEPSPMRNSRFIQPSTLLACLLLLLSPAVDAVDADAARKLAKQNNCFRCHAVEREKNGPAWADIGTKYKSKPDGENSLIKHLTSAPKVRLREDDVEEEHKIVKFRSHDDLENLARWVLSL
jgi:cytochrome c